MALTGVDHKRLVEAHIDGDEEAFAAIVRAYYESLFAHAMRRMGDAHAAEDAVQETLSRAYRALPRFSGDYQLRAWLHRILTNVCHDEGRRRQRENQVVERVAATYTEVPPIDHDLAVLDLPRREVLDALAALPASYRDALVLRYVEELSFHDVAEATGISEGNARLRVHRGRAALRRALAPLAGALVFLVPFLRRGQRAALAAQLGADSHASLVVAAPAATRVAEQGLVLVDRAPSLPSMIGVAASLVVPAAIPALSNQVANRVASPPAAVAAPLPPEATPTSQAPAGATGPAAAPGTAELQSASTSSEPSPTTTAPPATTSTTLVTDAPLRGPFYDDVGTTGATEPDTTEADPEMAAGDDPVDAGTDRDTVDREGPARGGAGDRQGPARGGAGTVTTDDTVPADAGTTTVPPALPDDQDESDAPVEPEAPAPAADETGEDGTVPDDTVPVVPETAPTTTVPPATTVPAATADGGGGDGLSGWVRDNLGTIAWSSSPLPRGGDRDAEPPARS